MPIDKDALKTHEGVAVDFQVGGAGHEWAYAGCIGVGPVTEDKGALTPVYCPGDAPGSRKVITKTRAIPANITFDVSTHYGVAKWLDELDCPANIRVRHFCAGLNADVNNYDQIKSLCDVDTTQRAFTDMAMLDTTNNVIDVTNSMDASATEYILRVSVKRQLANSDELDVALNHVFYCDAAGCGGGCNGSTARSDGCQRWYAVGDDRGPGYEYGANPILLMYDGTKLGETNKRRVREITGLLGDAIFGFCVGDRVFAFDASGSFAYNNDPWDDDEDWTVVSDQFEVGAYPTAAYVVGRQVFLSAQAGYVYGSTDGGLTYDAIAAGDLTAEDLNDINGYDDDRIVAAGNNGAVILSENGGDTWSDISLGIAVTINTINMPRVAHIYAGANDGILYWSHDSGETWFANESLGLGTGAIIDMTFCGECDDSNSAFLLYQLAGGDMRIARSLDGGASWPENLKPLPTDLPRLNSIACCDPNQFVAVGELFGGATPYAAVVRGKRAV